MLIVAVEYLFILSRKKDQINDTFIVCDVEHFCNSKSIILASPFCRSRSICTKNQTKASSNSNQTKLSPTGNLAKLPPMSNKTTVTPTGKATTTVINKTSTPINVSRPHQAPQLNNPHQLIRLEIIQEIHYPKFQ